MVPLLVEDPDPLVPEPLEEPELLEEPEPLEEPDVPSLDSPFPVSIGSIVTFGISRLSKSSLADV